MREEEFYGSWWTESDPDNEVAGVLTFDSDGLRLTLHGEWRDTSGSEEDSTVRLIAEHHPRILGFRHSDHKAVTLLDVRGRIVRMPVRTIGSRIYSVDMALVGSDSAPAQGFNKVSFSFDYLNAWMQPPGRTQRTVGESNMLHLDTSSKTLATCYAPDGYRASIRNGLSGTEGASTVSLEEYCAFDVESPAPTERNELLDRVRIFRDLLTISLGRAIRVQWAYLYFPSSASGLQVISHLDEPLVYGDEISDDQARNSVFDFQMPTLMTARARAESGPLGIPLNVLLSRWMKLHPLAIDALTVLLSPYTTDVMLPHHRYSSVFSAVEELHKALNITQLAVAKSEHQARRRRVAGQLADCTKELRNDDARWLDDLIRASRNDRSLAQKLLDVLEESGDLGVAVRRVAPNFARNAARSRGKISHGNAGAEAERAARVSYELVIEWILRAVILSRLLNVRDREEFFRAASERRIFTLMLSRLAATEQ